MMHKPIYIQNLELSFPQKTCFTSFSTQISYGSHIAIIGRNGSGKSCLLKILYGTVEATSGSIHLPDGVFIGYVPQVIEEFESLSGGQRLNKAITIALSVDPNLLLLDEPTNHLDSTNRKNLIHRLAKYTRTCPVASHDIALLTNYFDTFWHIDNGKIHVFRGNYDDYMRETQNRLFSIEQELSRLDRQKKDMHDRRMQEQKRAAKSKAKGEKSIGQRKWPTVVSKTKALRATETAGHKKAAIDHKKQELSEQVENLCLPEIIVPKFSISSSYRGDRMHLEITQGAVAYIPGHPVLKNISLSCLSKDRIAIMGDNGSGKSTLVKAILGDELVHKTGEWYTPNREDMGYLDQHYSTLHAAQTVLESLSAETPHWSHAAVRRHLADFLFSKNEAVNAYVHQLSGGEKVRLSLAQIAAKTPTLLILDEITNNLDIETRTHVINVLKTYPGTLIVISHDENFLDQIDIDVYYQLLAGQLLSPQN